MVCCCWVRGTSAGFLASFEELLAPAAGDAVGCASAGFCEDIERERMERVVDVSRLVSLSCSCCRRAPAAQPANLASASSRRPSRPVTTTGRECTTRPPATGRVAVPGASSSRPLATGIVLAHPTTAHYYRPPVAIWPATRLRATEGATAGSNRGFDDQGPSIVSLQRPHTACRSLLLASPACLLLHYARASIAIAGR